MKLLSARRPLIRASAAIAVVLFLLAAIAGVGWAFHDQEIADSTDVSAPTPAASAEPAEEQGGTIAHDFGTKAVGGSVSYAFLLNNNTSHLKRISGIEVSCGCLTPSAPTELRPFSQGQLLLETALPQLPGTFSANATIQYDDGTSGRYVLHGHLIRRAPAELDFGPVRKDDEPAKEFLVSSVSGQPIKITGVGIDPRVAEVSHRLESPDGSRHHFTVRLKPAGDDGIGPFKRALRISTSETGQEDVVVDLVGRVMGRVEAESTTLAVGTAKADEWVDGEIRVRLPYDRPQGGAAAVVAVVVADRPSAFRSLHAAAARWDGEVLVLPFEVRHLGESAVEETIVALTIDPDAAGPAEPQAVDVRLFLLGRTATERAADAMPSPPL